MGAITPCSYAHFHTSLTAGVLSVLSVWQWLSAAVKRQWGRNRDVEWLLGSFAEGQGNFPHHQLSFAVCQPLLPTLAATVPTPVCVAAYDSNCRQSHCLWLWGAVPQCRTPLTHLHKNSAATPGQPADRQKLIIAKGEIKKHQLNLDKKQKECKICIHRAYVLYVP